jgi:hypothetical protein
VSNISLEIQWSINSRPLSKNLALRDGASRHLLESLRGFVGRYQKTAANVVLLVVRNVVSDTLHFR